MQFNKLHMGMIDAFHMTRNFDVSNEQIIFYSARRLLAFYCGQMIELYEKLKNRESSMTNIVKHFQKLK